MEGVGYSLQHNLKTAEEIGIKVDVLRSVGGAATVISDTDKAIHGEGDPGSWQIMPLV